MAADPAAERVRRKPALFLPGFPRTMAPCPAGCAWRRSEKRPSSARSAQRRTMTRNTTALAISGAALFGLAALALTWRRPAGKAPAVPARPSTRGRNDRSRRRRPGRPADEPSSRPDRDLGPGGQRYRALSRLVPQQGDGDPARDRDIVAGGQRARQCRQTARGPSRARWRLCRRGADGAGRHMLSHLQHQQEARRVLVAEPVLLGADRGSDGADLVRRQWAFWRNACATRHPAWRPPSGGVSAGRAVAAATSVGLLGTVAEAGLLHFRGAYHDPFMFLPVTIPPLAAALIGNAAFGPHASAAAGDAVLAALYGVCWASPAPASTSSASPATWAAGATGGRTC